MPPAIYALHLAQTRAAVLNYKASPLVRVDKINNPLLADHSGGWYYKCSLTEPVRESHGKRVPIKPRCL